MPTTVMKRYALYRCFTEFSLNDKPHNTVLTLTMTLIQSLIQYIHLTVFGVFLSGR